MKNVTRTRVIVVGIAIGVCMCIALAAQAGFLNSGGQWENPGCRQIREAVAAKDAWIADPNAVASDFPAYSDANNPSHWYSDGCQGPVPS